MEDEGYEPKYMLLSFFCHNKGESNISGLGLRCGAIWPGTSGPGLLTPNPGWPGAFWLGEQLAQPIPRVRLEDLVFFFSFFFLPLHPQVQGVSGTLKTADKKLSSSLGGGVEISGLGEIPAVGRCCTRAQPSVRSRSVSCFDLQPLGKG